VHQGLGSIGKRQALPQSLAGAIGEVNAGEAAAWSTSGLNPGTFPLRQYL
jgi:hypothetical protein